MRATSVAYFTLINITAIALFLFKQTNYSYAFQQTLYLIPCCVLGIWLGNKLFPYLSQTMFNKIIYIMLLFSALYTLYSALDF